jgi:hypothetical protein
MELNAALLSVAWAPQGFTWPARAS